MMHPMLNIATQAAREASRLILRCMDQMDKIDIMEKSRDDFVTQVDKLSEEIIIEHIRKAYPKHTILSEECGHQKGSDEQHCWIIDPLDGTSNFIHGFPQFAISIALMKKDKLELGLVYDPIRQELFTATRGQGAYLNSRRIRVSSTEKMAQALIATGFPFRDKNKTKDYLDTFEKVFTSVHDIRRTGSAALDLAYVAAGRLDGFWEADLKIWDIAAGSLMIQEAGGVVSDFKNQSDYLHSGDIVSGNIKVHKQLVGMQK